MSREEFRMRLEELILEARPDLNLGDMYNLKTLEEDLFGKRGREDNPIGDVEGYAGWIAK